ncbi:cysteine hydrolase family protein [Lysinibacillus sp. 54212]|uniref:cysteine hydrolase family protein n=1 Tax=Lysinibacillus sp. 54212 TaxID=3119829 RepID=UPI002FC7A8F3
MNTALIVIDYTVDFVADDGKLTCGAPGQAIELKITRLIQQFLQEEQLVVFANDIHYEGDTYHPEAKLFPPHNIAGTVGRELYGTVKDAYDKNKQHCISLNKTRYSAFAGTNLHQLLQERKIHEIHLVGVCTDICILHTAVDAYNYGYKITIYRDGVASFNEAGHQWALEHFTSTLGVDLV